MHALHSVYGACTSFEGTLPHDMYVFGISTVNVVNWNTFEKDQKMFLKKSIFSSKGPPFGKVVFWPREGQNLKISEVPTK